MDTVSIRIKRDHILLILIVILLITNIFTLNRVNQVIEENSFDSFVLKYPFIDPARNFVDQKHFITNIQPLRKSLLSYVAEQKEDVDIGIYFEFLNTGANISINQEMRFFPASLIKMPTALAVMNKVEKGEWKLTNELVLFPEDVNGAYGDLYKQPIGTKFTIEELMKELLINSDDTAHRILVRNLDDQIYQNILDGLGITDLIDKNYNVTAKEYSRIFRSLYSSSFLGKEYSQTLLKWLTETPFNNFLGQSVPSDVVFSHKIGEHDQERTYLDSGIVYIPNRPYIITVMVKVKNGQQSKAEEVMKYISKASYDYINQY